MSNQKPHETALDQSSIDPSVAKEQAKKRRAAKAREKYASDPECRKRAAAARKQWCERNREANAEKARLRHLKRYANPIEREKIKARVREYGASNAAKISEYNKHRRKRKKFAEFSDEEKKRCYERMRAWRENNPDKVRVSKKKDWQRNSEKRKETRRKYYQKNKQSIYKKHRAYMSAHPEITRAITESRRKSKSVTPKTEKQAIYRFVKAANFDERAVCYWCGRAVPKKRRHIDHIIPLSKGGVHALSNLCVSCSKCNLSKSSKMPEKFHPQLLLL